MSHRSFVRKSTYLDDLNLFLTRGKFCLCPIFPACVHQQNAALGVLREHTDAAFVKTFWLPGPGTWGQISHWNSTVTVSFAPR